METAPTSAANTLIGAYRIQRKLGEGGMGTVYLAEHSLIGRPAAIKVLLPALSANQDIINRFFNEARATTSIPDPGIVQIFDFGFHTDGSAYIVMEFLEGESLEGRLRRLGRLRVDDTLRLIRQIASSLASAHAKGIVHRDLKPENLFVVGDPAVTGGERAKILDFGIAKLAGDEPGRTKTRTGVLIGTPVYMSPEQCRGAGDIDLRSDVYSLGCVLFCLLTGRPPFDCESVGEVIASHLREPAPAPSAAAAEVPPAVDELVLRCLAKTPAARYQTMRELIVALDAAADSLGVPGHRPWTTPAAGVPVMLAHQLETRIVQPSAAVTTLQTASGQTATAERPAGAPARVRNWRLVGISAAAAAVLGVVLFVAIGRGGGGGGESGDEPARPAAAGPPAKASVPVRPAVERPVPPAPVATPIAPIEAAAPAGDGAAAAQPSSAGKSDHKRSKRRGGKRDARSTSGSQPQPIDRGD